MPAHTWAYHARTALASIRATPVMQAVAVSTIAVALLVFGGCLLLLLNVDRLSQDWGRDIRLIAFLAEDTAPERLDALAQTLEAWPEIEAVEAMTPARSLAAFRDSLGEDGDVLDGVSPEVMPASLEITLISALRTPEGLGGIAWRLSSMAGLDDVEQVAYGRALLERVRALRDLLRIGGLVVAIFVLCAVAFIIANTIRLGLYARRDELEIMQLVGATEGFIRAPYYIEGVFQGVLGAGVGLLLLWAAFMILAPGPQAMVQFELGRIRLYFLPPLILAAMLAGGAALGALASHISVNRFLRAQEALD